MDTIPKIYISFEADELDQKLELAAMSDKADEIRRISQAIERGNEIWRSWCITVGGDSISLNGGVGRVCVGADHLEDLESIKERFASALDSLVSIGVGLKLYEADRALEVAKLRGGDKVVFYTPELEEEIKEAEEPEEPIFADKLDKAEHPLAGQFQQIIEEQEAAEHAKQQAAQESEQTSQMKAQVVQILQAVRQNSKELETLKEDAPHLYESIQNLVQALILMGRGLKDPQSLNKSELAAPKIKHFVMHYPIGFLLPPGTGNKRGGRIKVAHANGKTSWVSVRSGMVQNSGDGSPASSRNPNAGNGQ